MAEKSDRTLRYEKKNPEVGETETEKQEDVLKEVVVLITEGEEKADSEVSTELSGDETPKKEEKTELQEMREMMAMLCKNITTKEEKEENQKKAEERSIEDRRKAEETTKKLENLIIESRVDSKKELNELNEKIEVVIKNTEDTKKELNENIQKFKQEIEYKFSHDIGKTNTHVIRVEKDVEKLNEKVSAIRSQITPEIAINNKIIHTREILEEQMDVRFANSKQVMSQQVSELESRVDVKINDQGEKLKQIEEIARIKSESANSSINLSALQDITWPTNNGQAIKFYEKGDFNPKQFIKYAKRSTSHIRDVNKFKNCICSMMGGNAKKWFGCVQDKFEDFVGFERLFLDHYWYKQAQGRIRNELMNGKFKGYGRRNDYAENIINEVTQLEPEVSEEEIVEHLANHFCQDIINRVALENINTISELSKLLRRTDAVNMDERANRYNNNATRNFNNYSGGQQDSNNKRTYNNNGNDNRNNQDNRYNRYERSGNYNQNNNYTRNNNNFENHRGTNHNFNTNNRDNQDNRNGGYNSNRNNFGRGNYYGNNRNYNQGYRGRFQRGGRYESNWRSYDNRTNDRDNQQGGDDRYQNRTSTNTENRPINSVTINRTPAVEEGTSSPQDFQ